MVRQKKPSNNTQVVSTNVTSREQFFRNPDIMIFSGEEELPVGVLHEQGLGDWVGEHFGRRKEDVKAEWDVRLEQIKSLLDGITPDPKDFELHEVKFELGFSAEGQLVFVAKAGIRTTISTTFRRRAGS